MGIEPNQVRVNPSIGSSVGLHRVGSVKSSVTVGSSVELKCCLVLSVGLQSSDVLGPFE